MTQPHAEHMINCEQAVTQNHIIPCRASAQESIFTQTLASEQVIYLPIGTVNWLKSTIETYNHFQKKYKHIIPCRASATLNWNQYLPKLWFHKYVISSQINWLIKSTLQKKTG